MHDTNERQGIPAANQRASNQSRRNAYRERHAQLT